MAVARVPASCGRLAAALVLVVGGCTAGPEAPARPGGTRTEELARTFLDEVVGPQLRPGLLSRLRESPHALFRFTNRPWVRAVCQAFADDLAAVPTVRLHGDAHLEQYAVTSDTRGLDDFDDSATGPAVIDIVRFLGSVRIAAAERGWPTAADAAADAFFEGYRRALQDTTYLPPDPAVVARLRSRVAPSDAEFLAWAESQMEPLSAEERARLDEAWLTFEAYARQADHALSPNRLAIKKVGWLRMGIGSALTPKVLARVEGPSPTEEDDLIVEGKAVVALTNRSCLSVPSSGEVFRVVEGVSQVGRLRHQVLVVVPYLPDDRPGARGWWVKDWVASYQELAIRDLAAPGELIEIAHDVGAQLGSTNLLDFSEGLAPQKRLMELEGVIKLETRIRQLAADLARVTDEVWTAFRVMPASDFR